MGSCSGDNVRHAVGLERGGEVRLEPFSFLSNLPKNAIATNAELADALHDAPHHLPGGLIEPAGETPGFPIGRHLRQAIAEYPYITFDGDFRTGETGRPCT